MLHAPGHGERLVSRWQYKNIFREGVVDIIQPDVAMVGGILEMKKIISMAEAFDMAAAPHAPYGPIALAGHPAGGCVLAQRVYPGAESGNSL